MSRDFTREHRNRKEDIVAKDLRVSEELAKKFATERDSPYRRWVASEGLDIIPAHYHPATCAPSS